jgi:hypothetical protein
MPESPDLTGIATILAMQLQNSLDRTASYVTTHRAAYEAGLDAIIARTTDDAASADDPAAEWAHRIAALATGVSGNPTKAALLLAFAVERLAAQAPVVAAARAYINQPTPESVDFHNELCDAVTTYDRARPTAEG